VPRLPDRQSDIGPFRSILGYSALVDLSMRRLGVAEWWYSGQWSTVQVHSDGVEVACRLADKLRRDWRSTRAGKSRIRIAGEIGEIWKRCVSC